MKTLKLLIAFLATATFTIACSNDDETNVDAIVYPEENPYQVFLDESGLNNLSNQLNAGQYYEAGLRFKPTVKGKINKIFVKLPAAQTNLRVTIWDAESETALRTETIETVAADTETSKTISPITLEKNKEYTLTFSTNTWYQRDNTNSSIPYPIAAGNIEITGFLSGEGDSQTYPSSSHPAAIAGDLSFAFQRTQ